MSNPLTRAVTMIIEANESLKVWNNRQQAAEDAVKSLRAGVGIVAIGYSSLLDKYVSLTDGNGGSRTISNIPTFQCTVISQATMDREAEKSVENKLHDLTIRTSTQPFEKEKNDVN